MLLPLLAVLQAGITPPLIYDGRQRQLDVRLPRIEAKIVVDGVLDEPVWQKAARLVGFSEYLPVDGIPAADSTEVLVWYAPDAICFGIRAFEAHGAVHATLANRDDIAADDYVQILLDTFDDHRTAYVFGVNPLGVQADGILSEGVQSLAAGIGNVAPVRDTVDFSADFTYQSRGHVTPYGYEIEVRIPFRSIRYRSDRVQQWGINIIRQVQHSGYQDTWAPARQANASFLAQSGTFSGLTGLERGLVLDVNPELTSHVDGGPMGDGSGYHYSAGSPQLGASVRWAVTDNLTADATAKPDFSEVEADVPQLVYDPRDALYYPEKRLFFLDGIEQFDTPNQLIYTRRIVQPVGAVKLTGQVTGMDLGFLSAFDAASTSATGRDHPFFALLRARHDVGGGGSVGVVATDREDGGLYNRVGGGDARLLFGTIYSLRLQAAASETRVDSTSRTAPLWQAIFQRAGHRLRLRYALSGIDPNFQTQSGFISRSGITTGSFDQEITFFGGRRSFVESWTADFSNVDTWDYQQFLRRGSASDVRWHLSNQLTLRGGWSVVGNVFIESYGYDPTLYAAYAIAEPTATGVDTVPFVGVPHLPNLDIVTGLSTPHWSRFDASIQTITGYDENFYEWASADIVFINAALNWRPSSRARVSALYSQQQYIRRTDHSTVAVRRIPWLKLEYQLARPLFVRLIGQYDAEFQDSLRDDSRTNDPILIRNPSTGIYERAARTVSNGFQVNWLISYQPAPGTVIYLGYGNDMTEPGAFAFRDLRRVSDSLFAKVSYLFRLGE